MISTIHPTTDIASLERSTSSHLDPSADILKSLEGIAFHAQIHNLHQLVTLRVLSRDGVGKTRPISFPEANPKDQSWKPQTPGSVAAAAYTTGTAT